MRLLVATTNRHKLREIGDLLGGLPLTIVTLADHPGLPQADESGATFRENARAKALHYSAITGLPAVAEDSGLEVAALDGGPGVHSARYNGATYEEKFEALYRELARRGDRATDARFVCALSYARDGAVRFETLGVVGGRIAPAPRGAHGFGYDPIFYYPPYGRTLAEVSAEEKLAVSHRGQAFRQFREYLRGTTL